MKKLNQKGLSHHLLLAVVAVVAVIGAAGYFVWQKQSNKGIDAKAGTCINTYKKGSSGNCVGYIQKFLNQLNNAGLTVNNTFDTSTVNAVKAYQSKYKLTVDGVVGKAQTWPSFCKQAELLFSTKKEAVVWPIEKTYLEFLDCRGASTTFQNGFENNYMLPEVSVCRTSKLTADKAIKVYASGIYATFPKLGNDVPITFSVYYADSVDGQLYSMQNYEGYSGVAKGPETNVFSLKTPKDYSFVKYFQVKGKYLSAYALPDGYTMHKAGTTSKGYYVDVSKIPTCFVD